MLKDWNFWCSILTALTVVLALGLSAHQTRLSNDAVIQDCVERQMKKQLRLI